MNIKIYNLVLLHTFGALFCIKKCTIHGISYNKFKKILWEKYLSEYYCSTCFTCSTIDASLPSAKPWLSSRVITALPSFMTRRRAYFSWLLSENVDFSPSSTTLLSLRLTWKEYKNYFINDCCTKMYFVLGKIRNLFLQVSFKIFEKKGEI